MKRILVILMTASCTALYAGDFSKTGNYKIHDYDYQVNRYYFGIVNPADDDKTINICVYDSVRDKSVNIFSTDNSEVITGFIFQRGYSVKKREYILNNRHGYDSYDDMSGIDFKKASPNLLIITRSEREKTKKLYMCAKTGENLKEIYRFDDDTKYEMDNVNSRIIFRKQSGRQLVITSFSY